MTEKLSADKLVKMTNDELAKVSKAITGRINNEDWQKVIFDLRRSGHIHTIEEDAPPLLQSFLRLEIDLDAELGNLSGAAPLMSTIKLSPRRPRGEELRLLALMNSQDMGANIHFEIRPKTGLTRLSFGIKNMITLYYNLPTLPDEEKEEFLDLMRRDTGLTILWTQDRWESDYVIFSREEFYTRIYAFSANFESTARLTTEVTGTLLDWLDRAWFPGSRGRRKRTSSLLELPAWQIQEKPVEAPKRKTQKTAPILTMPEDEILDRMMGVDEAGRKSLLAELTDEVDKAVLKALWMVVDQRNRQMLQAAIQYDDKRAVLAKVGQKLVELTDSPNPDSFEW